jgi:hypothetical protein
MQTNSPNLALQAAFLDMSPEKRRVMSRRIRVNCGISRSTLYDWKSSRSQIPKNQLSKICEIIGTNIFADIANR